MHVRHVREIVIRVRNVLVIAPIAATVQLDRSALMVLAVQNAGAGRIAAPTAAVAETRSDFGPRAERPHGETAMRASASLRRIATRSASVRSEHFTKHRKSQTESPLRCSIVSRRMN